SVAYDPVTNRYLVVWAREMPSSNYDIYGRFIPWDGIPTASEFPIDSSTSDDSSSPKVAYALAQGEYLVVWEDYSGGWPEYRVSGRRVKAVGGGWPARFTIAEHASENRRNPHVAYNLARNEYLVTYDNMYLAGTNNENIYGKRLAGDGTVLGGELGIAGWPDDEVAPAVAACDGADQYLVTWTSVQSGGKRVYARFVDGDGTLKGVHQIDDSTTDYPYSPAAVDCKWGVQYMVTWERYAGGSLVGIRGRVAYSDESMDSSFEIEVPHSPHRERPAVACSDPNCLVAWEHRDASGYAEIYGRIVGETKPKAAFTVSPAGGDTSTLFQFDASSSSDLEDPASALQVRWDWQDDGIYDTAWSTTITATHQYMIPCWVANSFATVRLQVKDTYGLTDSTAQSVSVGNTGPTAAFTVIPAVGDNSTYFQFDASISSDAECATSNLEARWDWEDDGTWDTLWSTTKTAGVTFGAAAYGWQTTRLEVRDTPGLTDTTSDGVKIDHAPTAAFTVNPTSGNVDTVFQFDPSSSRDPDVNYHSLHARWDWEDDGTWDTGWLMCWQIVGHTYGALGTYTARLEVREGLPSLTDSTTRQVQVVNTAPTAAFTVNPTTGDTSTTFQLNASSSSDLEEPLTALQVRWDYENDGTYDSAWSTTKTASGDYPAPGAYTIRLQVRDSGGLTHSTTHQVTVQAPSANTAPQASFTVTPASGDTSTLFSLDASGSTDAEDSVPPDVRWDWNNDGTFDTGWNTVKTATHTFNAAGTHTVRLEVRDTGSLTDATTHQVTVAARRFVYLPLVLR
ncbi:MAG: hypothetical protein GQ526_11935, partial [Ardenticatenales bacterium]|nr:hypothetical protein [Ardenticatenales bacterium]